MNYVVAVIANNNVVIFLKLLLESLECIKFDFSKFYLGDAGLDDHNFKHEINIIDLPNKKYGKFRTQSPDYRYIISNRVRFLNRVSQITQGQSILQLDADTYVIKDDFSLVDSSADVTLTVREAEVGGYIPKFVSQKSHYPNLGVVFWNKPDRCKQFWRRWDELRTVLPPHPGQYEQNIFLHAMQEESFKKLKAQKIQCYYYNCYDPSWLRYNPSILHFKGPEGRDETSTEPHPTFLQHLKRTYQT